MITRCTGDAGRSFPAAELCRHLADQDLRVTLFSAQDMSAAAVRPVAGTNRTGTSDPRRPAAGSGRDRTVQPPDG